MMIEGLVEIRRLGLFISRVRKVTD